jgi:tetratricopeptide (TPR) repeat protein
MVTSRHVTVEFEFLHWLVVLVAALAMLLALATALAADPRESPASPDRVQFPGGALARPFFPEHPPLPADAATEIAEKLGMTLAHQRAGCFAEALAGWEEVRLPPETSVWRQIGMAAAQVQMDDLPLALRRLELAEQIAPRHPLIAYYRGLVWKRQAERLAATEREAGLADAAAEKGELQRMAIADLRETIERADLVDLAEPLVVIPPESGGQVSDPQVRDLLVALEAERFVDDAHRHLFRLHLDRRELFDADQILDWAVKAGVAGTPEMRQLAQALQKEGQTTEALRVMHEVVRLDHPGMERGWGRIQQWLAEPQSSPWLW